MRRLVVVGLGLIGGSVALGARRAFAGLHITALDRPSIVGDPAARGLVDAMEDVHDGEARRRCYEAADLVVLSTPVGVVAKLLPEAVGHAAAVTDCGSTKREVVAAVEHHPKRHRFVPGHPMAGSPEGGFGRASADLFMGRRWLLCPSKAEAGRLTRVRDLAGALGAEVVDVGVEEHDEAVALTSHVPQLLASALTVLAARRGAADIAGPGFASATRVAGGGDAMWRDIFASNGDQVARTLRHLATVLDEVAQGLEQAPSDVDAALSLLEQARSIRRPS